MFCVRSNHFNKTTWSTLHLIQLFPHPTLPVTSHRRALNIANWRSGNKFLYHIRAPFQPIEIDTSWHSIIFDSFKMQRVSSPELIWDSTRQFVLDTFRPFWALPFWFSCCVQASCSWIYWYSCFVPKCYYLQPVGLSQTVQSWCTMCIPWPWTSWTLCCPTSLGGREPMHINRLKQVKIPELGWIKLKLFPKPLSWEDHHDFEACDVIRHESSKLLHDYHLD